MFITSEIIRCMINAARTTVDMSYTRYFRVIYFSVIHPIDFFFKLGFTSCKTGLSLKGIKLQENEDEKDEKQIRKLIIKNPKIKRGY